MPRSKGLEYWGRVVRGKARCCNTSGLSSADVPGLPLTSAAVSLSSGYHTSGRPHPALLFAPISREIAGDRAFFLLDLCYASGGCCLLRLPSLFQGKGNRRAQPCEPCRPGWCSALHRPCGASETTQRLSQNVLIMDCLWGVQKSKQDRILL